MTRVRAKSGKGSKPITIGGAEVKPIDITTWFTPEKQVKEQITADAIESSSMAQARDPLGQFIVEGSNVVPVRKSIGEFKGMNENQEGC